MTTHFASTIATSWSLSRTSADCRTASSCLATMRSSDYNRYQLLRLKNMFAAITGSESCVRACAHAIYIQDCSLVTPLTPTTDYQHVTAAFTRTNGRTNGSTNGRTNVVQTHYNRIRFFNIVFGVSENVSREKLKTYKPLVKI